MARHTPSGIADAISNYRYYDPVFLRASETRPISPDPNSHTAAGTGTTTGPTTAVTVSAVNGVVLLTVGMALEMAPSMRPLVSPPCREPPV